MDLDLNYFFKAYKEAMQTEEIECLEDASKSIEWISKQCKHNEFVDFITEYPFFEPIQACAHNFYGPEEIVEWSTMYDELLDRFIVIGSAPNGDFIASPLPDMNCIGFICHDNIGTLEFPQFINVDSSFGKFFYNSWHIEGYPCDYWHAINLLK